MTINYTDGTSVRHTLRHHAWFTTGDVVPSSSGMVVAGGLYDKRGSPIMDASFTMTAGGRQFFSDCPDGMSLIAGPTQSSAVSAGRSASSPAGGNVVYAVVQFEYVTSNAARAVSMYGKLPMAIAVVTLNQHPLTGDLEFVKYENVDMAPVNGLWIPCAGSRSPWNTHLSSEECECPAPRPGDRPPCAAPHAARWRPRAPRLTRP
jgi:hypothetical protein